MPVYILAGPAVALIGIVSIFFVMRRRAVDKRSMYSSRRSQIERKVRAARQRTLVPHGRGEKAPAAGEMAASAPSVTAAPGFQAPAYQAPAAPLPPQAWEMGASPAAPAYQAPAYEAPPAAPAFEPQAPAPPPPPPSAPAAEPSWTPAPAEPVWTPAPVADSAPAPVAEPAAEPASEPLTPAGGGASWSIVGADVPATEERAPKDGKEGKGARGGKKEKAQTGSAWQLASGNAPGEEEDEAPKRPSATTAVAQYAILVVGLVMVLIGVLVMVANTKVT